MITNDLEEYQISIKRVYDPEVNSYRGLTLLYLLKGKIEIITNDNCITLEQQQIYLINKNDHYTLISQQDNLLITLEISNNYIIRYYPIHLTCRYFLSSSQIHSAGLENSYLNDVMVLIAKITVTHIQKNIQSLLYINRLLSELLLMITSLCQVEVDNQIQKLSGYSPKIEKVVQYIKNNYHQKLSLQQIAKNEYISFGHLSRLFKKEVGIGFSQYVNQLKFESILHELINTSKKVYQIAEEHGFSNIKQFILQFKKKYNATPAQFRKNYQQGTISNTQKSAIEPQDDKINLAEVIYLLSEIIHNRSNFTLDTDQYNHIENQEVIISSNNKAAKLPDFCYTLFVGKVSELLKCEVQQQLLITQKEIVVHYVEVCDLFTGDSILPEFPTDEYFSTYNPYDHTDSAINFLYRNNISLCLRIEHEQLTKDSSLYIKKLVTFLTHCINYFSHEYIKQWRFIYYLENSSQLSSPSAELAFEQLADTIKNLTETAKLGIFYPFANRTNYRNEPIFLNKIINNIDFIGYSASFDENSLLFENEKDISNYVDFIHHKTTLLKKGLHQNGLTKPLYLMQWNTLTGNTRKTNGRFFRGALLLKTLLDLSHDIKNITLILNTNTQQEVRANHIDTSSIALFLVHEARRPIFFILKFIQKLKGRIISRGKNYLITQNGDNYQILIINISIFNPYLSIKENLTHSFKNNRLLTIKGIPSGIYQIKRYLFDQEHGGLYKQYEKFQTKYGKNEEVFEYLAQLTKPDFSINDEYIDINNWQLLTKLDINAIGFYELNYIKSRENEME